MQYTAVYQSPLGPLTLACDPDGRHLTGAWLEGQKHFAASLAPDAEAKSDLPVLEAARRWLDRYFAGEQLDAAELPLAPQGSAYQQAVWTVLRGIPAGRVTTYGAIARQMNQQGARTSARAVGGAVGRNPLSIFIPCHRVVGANGSLTGYAGGMEANKQLLTLEGALKPGEDTLRPVPAR